MSSVIFTNCGKLGDMFLCLPIISWYYKTFKTEIIFAVSSSFPYAKDAYDLLMKQECISDVVYFTYDGLKCDTRTSDNLGRYHVTHKMLSHNYSDVSSKIYSLGFHRWPDKYVPELYAEEYGFGVDYDFKLEYGSAKELFKDDNVKIDRYESPMLNSFTNYISIPQENGMLENLQYAAGAANVLTFTTGFSIMATLARIPVTIYGDKNLIKHHENYFKINGGINWIHF